MIPIANNQAITDFQKLAAKNAEEAVKGYLQATLALEPVAVQNAMLVEAFRMSGVNVKDHPSARSIIDLSEKLDGLKAKQHDALGEIRASVRATFEANPIAEADRGDATIDLIIESTTQRIVEQTIEKNKGLLSADKQRAALVLLDGMFTVMGDQIKGQEIRNVISRHSKGHGGECLIDTTAVDISLVDDIHQGHGNGRSAT